MINKEEKKVVVKGEEGKSNWGMNKQQRRMKETCRKEGGYNLEEETCSKKGYD